MSDFSQHGGRFCKTRVADFSHYTAMFCRISASLKADSAGLECLTSSSINMKTKSSEKKCPSEDSVWTKELISAKHNSPDRNHHCNRYPKHRSLGNTLYIIGTHLKHDIQIQVCQIKRYKKMLFLLLVFLLLLVTVSVVVDTVIVIIIVIVQCCCSCC